MQIRRGSRRALCAAAVVLGVAPLVRAADVDSVWFGGSADWNNPANWSNTPSVAQFPNNGNGGLTYDATVSAGTATQQSDLTFDALTLTGGTIAGSGYNLNLNQTFNWSGGSLSGGGVVSVGGEINFTGAANKTLNGTLSNAGTATWTDTGGVFGSGTFNNLAGANFNAEAATSAFGVTQFNNNGTVMKLTPSSVTNFGGVTTFNNAGTVNVFAGTLNINGPVAQAPGATLAGGTWIVGGTLNLNGVGDITTLASGASVTLIGFSSSFSNIIGLTTNQGTFAVAGKFFSTAGPFSNTGTISVGASSGFTVTTSLAQQVGDALTGGTYFVTGSLSLPGGSITTNQADFTLNGASSVCTSINALADNQGTFTLSGGRSFTSAGALNNSGTMDTGPSSVLTLAAGGTHTGSFVVDVGGTVSLTGGTHTFNTAAAFSGGGTLNINGGAILDGNANFSGPANTNWNAGTIGGGGGSLDIPSTATLRLLGSGAKSLDGVINNSGTTQWSGNSGVFGTGTFNNLPGATFQIQSGSTTAFGVAQFNNSGTVSKTTAGPANNFGGAMTFNNTGTVNVNAGTLNINGPLTQVSGATLTGGTWNASNATLVLTAAGSLAAIGPAATVSLTGASSVLGSINTLADNQGAFTITNGRNFSTVGSLSNSGTLTVGLNSTLTVNGMFTNTGTVTGDIVLGNGAITATSYMMQSGSVSIGLDGTGVLTKTTAGTATLTGANTYLGGTNVSDGTLVVNRLHENNAVNITGGTLQIADSSPTLPHHPAGNNASVSRPGSMITIANNGAAIGSRAYFGTLDLTNNDLVIDYIAGNSPIADVEDMIRAGRNGGAWNGKGIISSTAGSIAAAGAYTLGVIDNATAGITPFTTFSDQIVDTTTVLVKFVHRSDINMDGVVTFSDSVRFNGNYSEGTPTRWVFGDLNYNGVSDFGDSVLFNGGYDEALTSLPEPSALLPLCVVALASRRRRA